MIIGSSLTAFSLPAAISSSAGFSGLRLAPQKPAGDAPFAASPPASSTADPGKSLQRGSLVNLSV